MKDIDPEFVAVMAKLNENFKFMREQMEYLAGALRPGQEVENWKIYADEYGGIMCRQPGCVCSMEEEIVLTPYSPGSWPVNSSFTLAELFGAVKDHIQFYGGRKEEEEDAN